MKVRSSRPLTVYFMGLNLEVYTSMPPDSCLMACSSLSLRGQVVVDNSNRDDHRQASNQSAIAFQAMCPLLHRKVRLLCCEHSHNHRDMPFCVVKTRSPGLSPPLLSCSIQRRVSPV